MEWSNTIRPAIMSLWRRFTDSTVADKKQILPYVDGLRGIAILMVITYHLAQQVGSPFKVQALAAILGAGDRGVQLFFMLSAFTLFASSEKRYQTDKSPVLSFYIRRWFRILPFWILVNFLWALVIRPSPTTLVLSLTFLFGFVRFIQGYELVPGGWSLFVEETFYVFLPLIFGYIRNWYRALGLVVILWLVGDIWWRQAVKVAAFGHYNFVFFAPPAQWFAFGLGILLFYAVSNPKFRSQLLDNAQAYFLLDASVLLACWNLLSGDYRIATLALVVLIVASVPTATLFGRITRNALLRRLGRYSYSLYLLHFFFLSALVPVRDWLWRTAHLTAGPAELKLALYVPVFVAVMLIVGFLSFNLIEKPCIDVGRAINARLNRRLSPTGEAELTAL